MDDLLAKLSISFEDIEHEIDSSAIEGKSQILITIKCLSEKIKSE